MTAPSTVRSPLITAFIQGNMEHTEGMQAELNRIVIHATVSPSDEGGARNVADYFTQADASGLAHYVVDDKEIVGCASEDIVTWHAPPNPNSVGIEHCDPQTGTEAQDVSRWLDSYHVAMLHNSARLVVDIAKRWDLPLVRISTAEILAGKRGICGHDDVTNAYHQSTHTDPGYGFPWEFFMSLVASKVSAPISTPVKTPASVTSTIEEDDMGRICQVPGSSSLYWVCGGKIVGLKSQQAVADLRRLGATIAPNGRYWPISEDTVKNLS
jgi:N-acetyl-anhydromuramyl-L-alanine amidase AmpD